MYQNMLEKKFGNISNRSDYIVPSKYISLGFYPADGNIIGALLSPKDGYIWTPDPHYIPTTKGFEPAFYYDTDEPIIYNLTAKQAKYINTILDSSLCKLKDGSSMMFKHASLAKRENVRAALNAARIAREILGASGITLDHASIRHMLNLETVDTYEGTHDIHTLILGKDITGQGAFS